MSSIHDFPPCDAAFWYINPAGIAKLSNKELTLLPDDTPPPTLDIGDNAFFQSNEFTVNPLLRIFP